MIFDVRMLLKLALRTSSPLSSSTGMVGLVMASAIYEP